MVLLGRARRLLREEEYPYKSEVAPTEGFQSANSASSVLLGRVRLPELFLFLDLDLGL